MDAHLVVDRQRVDERLEARRLLVGGQVDDGEELGVVLAEEERLGQLAQEQLEEAGDVVRILVLLKVELAGCVRGAGECAGKRLARRRIP